MAFTPLEIAQALLACLETRDVDKMAAVMSEDFVWRYLPASLDVPEKNKQQYLAQTKNLGQVFASLKFGPPQDVVQSADGVAFLMIGEGQTAKGSPFRNEYFMNFHCESGKISKMTAYVDSKYMHSIFEAENGYGLVRDMRST
ncbi:hypothetical protein B0H10DRAFT_2022504 [Mycena sp. CBHHK59/15]|nr:hypothetical protein B0H10DRAFT_2022504 [Mycena sp. CBHHK59/15]